MAVSGDLATIDLADLLQNIETNKKTGTLTLLSDADEAKLFFLEGRVALLTRPGRTPLVELLVATGKVTQRRLDGARKKQKRSRRTVIEFLVGARLLPIEEVRNIAEDRLGEDISNLVAAANGEFRFVEETKPGPDFDPDEVAMQLSLAVAPLVLEATRRIDDWAEIKKFVPSGAMHFRARDGASPPASIDDQQTAAVLLDVLDGSRNAEEVIETFSDQRFQAYKMLAVFVRDRIVRPVDCDGLLEIAEELEEDDPARARALVQRALDSEPHHIGLLTAQAYLAEQLNDLPDAVEAHKLLAHLHLEQERPDEAQAALMAGQRLAPNDPSIWERSLQLALSQDRFDDALYEGMQLVEIHREPGLHTRAKAVLELLLAAMPESFELHIEFARTCVDCGEPREAVGHLATRAKMLVGDGEDADARALYSEILTIEPGHADAVPSIEMIDKQTFARRRARRRLLLQSTASGAVAAIIGVFVCCELLARIAYVETRSLLSREQVIEGRHHEEAITAWRQMASEHPLAVTTWFEIPRLIADLEQRIIEDNPNVRDR